MVNVAQIRSIKSKVKDPRCFIDTVYDIRFHQFKLKHLEIQKLMLQYWAINTFFLMHKIRYKLIIGIGVKHNSISFNSDCELKIWGMSQDIWFICLISQILTFLILLQRVDNQQTEIYQMDQEMRLDGKPKHIVLPEVDQATEEIPIFGKCMHCWGECCGCMRTWAPCLCCCFVDYPYKIVPQGNFGVYQKFGRYLRTVKPGLHYINPCTETLNQISMKINVMDLARQNIITRDNVSINIDASVYYRVVNARYAYYRVQNLNAAIAEVTYAILKNTCGQFVLQDLLEKRQEIADDIEQQVDQYVAEWGADVEEIFIKDIQLSPELQSSLSSAAKERRLAESKIISAKADVESAKLMRQAAEELQSKSAMQIRYLETMKMVGKSNTKVVFIPDMKNKERIQHLITQGLVG